MPKSSPDLPRFGSYPDLADEFDRGQKIIQGDDWLIFQHPRITIP
jgi:hypothetical protein